MGRRRAPVETNIRMDFDEIERLRARHPAWSVLTSDNVALVLSFLGRVFVDATPSNVTAAELVE